MVGIRLVVVLVLVLFLGACDRQGGTSAEREFLLVRLGPDGGSMEAASDSWDCVRDERTGLVWEVKTDQPGLRYRGNTYTWYEPDSKREPVDYRGMPDGGTCRGSHCDTSSYVAAVNEAALCGFTDWRLPHRQELRSISDPRRPIVPPTLDPGYFPNAEPSEYWSGNGYRMQHDAAWAWGFDTSLDRVDWKRQPKHVRLVRGLHKDLARLAGGEER